ncbi:MAG: NADAR family protein [Coriobacteriales bacterium]|nr:NADAR family protein [Coriobacteriales bacterium]
MADTIATVRPMAMEAQARPAQAETRPVQAQAQTRPAQVEARPVVSGYEQDEQMPLSVYADAIEEEVTVPSALETTTREIAPDLDAIAPQDDPRTTMTASAAPTKAEPQPGSVEAALLRDFRSVGVPASRKRGTATPGIFKKKDLNEGNKLNREAGSTLSDMIISDKNVPLDAVSVGGNVLANAYNHDGAFRRHIDSVVEATGYVTDDLATIPYNAQTEALIDIINNVDDAGAALMKYPVVKPSDALNVRVYAHPGRGIRLHPLAAKVLNADFGGDAAVVSYNKLLRKAVRNIIDMFIGADGIVNIDSDFFILHTQVWSEANIDAMLDMAVGNSATKAQRAAIRAGIEHVLKTQLDGEGDLSKLLRAISETVSPAVILKNIYDINLDSWAMEITNQDNSYVKPDGTFRKLPYSPDMEKEGQLPTNTLDAGERFGYPYTQTKKNFFFRIAAGFSKLIKRTRDILIGQDRWISKTLHNTTSEEKLAQQLSSVAGYGEQRYRRAGAMRRKIIGEVGVPSDYGKDIRGFRDTFTKWYNYYARIVNAVGGTMYIDGTWHDNSKVKYLDEDPNMKDFAAMVKKVYGDATMEKVFGNISPNSYKQHTVNEFVEHSRGFTWYKRKAQEGKPLKKGHEAETDKDWTWSNFMGALRNVRTAELGEINKVFNTLLLSTFDFYRKDEADIVDVLRKKGKSRLSEKVESEHDIVEANILFKAIALLSPDVFYALGIRDLDSMRRTDIGRRMLDATSPDELGGIIYEAVARYRLIKVQKAQASYDEIEFNIALDEMSYISDLWKAIVKDYKNGNAPLYWEGEAITSFRDDYSFLSNFAPVKITYDGLVFPSVENAFQAAKAKTKEARKKYVNVSPDEAKKLGRKEDLRDDWDSVKLRLMERFLVDKFKDSEYRKKLFATGTKQLIEGNTWGDKFWGQVDGVGENNLGKILMGIRGTNSGIDILMAPWTMSQKQLALDSLVKRTLATQLYQKSFITGDLMSDPKSLYAGPRSLVYDRTDILDSFRDAGNALQSATTSGNDSVRKKVNKFLEFVDKNGLDMEKWLNDMGTDYSKSFHIDLDNLAQAVTQVMELTFDSSEKSTAEAAAKWLYEATCTMKNGGVYSDLEIADDIALGRVSLYRLIRRPQILVWVLALDLSIEVYELDHRPITISRDTVFGGDPNINSAMRQMFEKHPRFALAFRQMEVIPADPSQRNARSRTIASDSLRGTATRETSVIEKALYRLVDEPEFLAFLILGVKTRGMKRQQSAYQVKQEIEGRVGDILKTVAARKKMSDEEWAENVEKRLSNLSTEVGAGGHQSVLTSVVASFERWTDKLSDLVEAIPEDTPGIAFNYVSSTSERAYFDIIQMFSGAKTDMSTGINGGESKRFGLLGLLSTYVPDGCSSDCSITMKLSDIDDATIADYYGRRLHETSPIAPGEFFSEGIYTDMKNASIAGEREPTIILEDPAHCTHPIAPCVRHQFKDPSTSLGKNITVLSRFMLDKRALGSEMLNLKVKTIGDDFLNSISKHDVIGGLRAAKDMHKLIQQLYRENGENGLAAARIALAEYLYYVNEGLRYKTISKQEFVGITHFLIRENEPGNNEAGVSIFSIGQLNDAINAVVLRGNYETDEQIIVKAVASLKPATTSASAVHDVSTRMNVSSGSYSENRVKLSVERMSSEERNMQLMEDIIAKNPDTDPSELGPKVIVLVTPATTEDDIELAFSRGNTLLLPSDYDERSKFMDIGVVTINGMYVIIGENIVERELTKTDEYGNETIIHQYRVEAFDILLNGENTDSMNGAFNIGSTYATKDSRVVLVELAIDNIGLSDSDGRATRRFVDRVHIEREASQEIDIVDDFVDVIASFEPGKIGGIEPLAVYDDTSVEVYPVFLHEVEDFLFSEDPIMHPKLALGKGNFSNRDLDRMSEKIKAYAMRLAEGGAYTLDDTTGGPPGFLKEAHPDDVIGFIKVDMWIKGNRKEFWHPVVAWEDQSAPFDAFNVVGAKINQETGRFEIAMRHEGSLENNLAKVFEQLFAGDKMVIGGDIIDQPVSELKNGMPIDILINKNSTVGRRGPFSAHQRIVTLIDMARITGSGYNMGLIEGSFPGVTRPRTQEDGTTVDVPVRELLARNEMETYDWYQLIGVNEGSLGGPEHDIRFTPDGVLYDPQLDAFLNETARRAMAAGIDPSDVFASTFVDEEGAMYNPMIYYRYDILVPNTGEETQDMFRRWFHYIDPTLIPKERGGDTSNTLFNDDFQMLVPYYDKESGKTYHLWSNVYVGLHFFDNHYTGFMPTGRTEQNTFSLSTLKTLFDGGAAIPESMLKDYRDHWALAGFNKDYSNLWVTDNNPDFDPAPEEGLPVTIDTNDKPLAKPVGYQQDPDIDLYDADRLLNGEAERPLLTADE